MFLRCITILWIIFSVPLLAVKAQMRDSLATTLKESVVLHQKANNNTLRTQVLREELKSLNALSVADALRFFTGLQLKDYGGVGGLKTINVRSMGSHHTAVTYNGIKVNNTQNGITDLSCFFIDDMSNIQLHQGWSTNTLPSASSFGLANVLEFESNKPIFSLSKKQQIATTLHYGSFATYTGKVHWSQQWNKVLQTSFSSRYLQSKGDYPYTYRTRFEDGTIANEVKAFRENSAVQSFTTEGNIFGQTLGINWQVRLLGYFCHRGLPNAVVRGTINSEDIQVDKQFTGQVLGEYKTEQYQMKARGQYYYSYLNYIANPNQRAGTISLNNVYKQNEIYASLSQKFLLNRRHALAFLHALDYKHSTLQANLIDFVLPERYDIQNVFSLIYNFKKGNLQSAIHLQALKDQTSIYISKRFNYYASPMVAVMYVPFPFLTISGFYKQSFRPPTFNDKYYTLIGNSDLLNEQSQQWNLEVGYSTKNFSLRVNPYLNYISNKIVAVPSSNPFRWTMTNLGKVQIKGLEMMFGADTYINRNIKLKSKINYTYQRALDITDAATAYFNHQIAYIPRHSLSLIGLFSYYNFAINYSWLYNSYRYNQSENSKANYMPPWYTTDVNFLYNFAFKKQQTIKINVGINNIFNQTYELVRGFPLPGRQFALSGVYSF